MSRVLLNVNGAVREVEADPATPLIHVLRNRLGLVGAKLGCGLEQCGACAVIADGEKVLSCMRAVSEFEGMRDSHGRGALRKTANSTPCSAPSSKPARRNAATARAALSSRSRPTCRRRSARTGRERSRALQGHLCRCGAHADVLRAVDRLLAGAADDP